MESRLAHVNANSKHGFMLKNMVDMQREKEEKKKRDVSALVLAAWYP
jgi:hypothetical protein